MTQASHESVADLPSRESGPDLVSAHLASRQVQRRGLRITSVLAIALLGLTAMQVYLSMRPEPDLVTFAFRV